MSAKRKSVSINEKLRTLELYDVAKNFEAVSRETGYGAKLISEWYASREELNLTPNSAVRKRIGGAGRRIFNEAMEQKVNKINQDI